MTAITPHRGDRTKNLHRYYRLDVQPDLFGAWCFIREWGRIGQRGGQSRTVPYPTDRGAGCAQAAAAEEVAARFCDLSLLRGSLGCAIRLLRWVCRSFGRGGGSCRRFLGHEPVKIGRRRAVGSDSINAGWPGMLLGHHRIPCFIV